VLAVTNAINFIDNMDGLSGGVAGIAAGYFLLLAVMNQQWLVAPLAAAVAGACIGFLIYNYNPATIFMGDAGTLFLGFLLAALGIKVVIRGQPPSISWLVPLLVLAVPLFDLSLVVMSRIRRRVNPFTTAGKDHLSHRLVRRGASAREAALITYLLGSAAGSLALLVSVATWVEALAIATALLALAAWALWRLELAPTQAGGG
jgi:UDP-GlcNAc:undecaprenyl-phosphate GlcNAc-1-phosphate transferase